MFFLFVCFFAPITTVCVCMLRMVKHRAIKCARRGRFCCEKADPSHPPTNHFRHPARSLIVLFKYFKVPVHHQACFPPQHLGLPLQNGCKLEHRDDDEGAPTVVQDHTRTGTIAQGRTCVEGALPREVSPTRVGAKGALEGAFTLEST